MPRKGWISVARANGPSSKSWRFVSVRMCRFESMHEAAAPFIFSFKIKYAISVTSFQIDLFIDTDCI